MINVPEFLKQIEGEYAENYIAQYNKIVDEYNAPEECKGYLRIRRKEVRRYAEEFYTKTTVKNGIVRWNSNNAIPPKEFLFLWHYLGYNFNFEQSYIISNKEDEEFLETYRKARQKCRYSEEELFEMQATFGVGTAVVDIITGKEITL